MINSWLLVLFFKITFLSKATTTKKLVYATCFFRCVQFTYNLLAYCKKTLFLAIKSGGNKRKVSAAIAFIGNPRLVILDEVRSFRSFLFHFFISYSYSFCVFFAVQSQRQAWTRPHVDTFGMWSNRRETMAPPSCSPLIGNTTKNNLLLKYFC